MKTFKTLQIGDKFYYFSDDNSLTSPENFKLMSSTVHSIKIKKDGKLEINEGYNSPELIVHEQLVNETNFKRLDYPRYIYFVNLSQANNFIRKAVVAKIDEVQKSIPDYAEKRKNEILAMREFFHEILNPSNYPNYEINQLG